MKKNKKQEIIKNEIGILFDDVRQFSVIDENSFKNDPYPIGERLGKYIIAKFIIICKKCHRWRGYVIEKFNGSVPVACICDLSLGNNPCMVSTGDGRLFWKPISDSKDETGKSWHTPYFSGPMPSKPEWIKEDTRPQWIKERWPKINY